MNYIYYLDDQKRLWRKSPESPDGYERFCGLNMDWDEIWTQETPPELKHDDQDYRVVIMSIAYNGSS